MALELVSLQVPWVELLDLMLDKHQIRCMRFLPCSRHHSNICSNICLCLYLLFCYLYNKPMDHQGSYLSRRVYYQLAHRQSGSRSDHHKCPTHFSIQIRIAHRRKFHFHSFGFRYTVQTHVCQCCRMVCAVDRSGFLLWLLVEWNTHKGTMPANRVSWKTKQG